MESDPRTPRTAAEHRTFLAELEASRSAVLASVAGPENGALARYIFALLTGAARAGHTELREDAVRVLAARMSIDLDTPCVPVGTTVLAPAAMLAARPPPSEQVEAINALFAAGFAAELAPLDPAQRRELTVQVVRLLPGVERLGPFVLSDYIDQACADEDAGRFWQVYVDRVAAEIARRTSETPPSRAPWLLLDLLQLHEQGPAAMETGSPNLKLHMNRALQARRDRWRFVRSMAEGCGDTQLLYSLCMAPAMVEDAEVVSVFLERGDPRLVSCALFVLQVRTEVDPVARVLSHFESRPLPEVGERLVEIHAQACLPRHPSPGLARLVAGIRAIVQRRVAEGAPVESLLGGVANDPRALRQVLLLAHGAPDAGGQPQRRHLLERVIGVWLQSFTPGGLRHTLNDEVFRQAVGRAGRLLVEEGVSDLARRLERFALDLPALARRWNPGDEAERRRTLSRFLAVFGHSVAGMAVGAAPAASQALHEVLVRVYIAAPSARGSGWFGVVDRALPALFPDVLRGTPSAERIGEVARRLAVLAEDVAPSAEAPTETGTAATPLDQPPPPDQVVRAPVELLPGAPGPIRTVLAAWLGVELVRWMARRAARLLGMRSRGEATLTGGTLVVEGDKRLLGRAVERVEERQALEHVVGVRVRQRMRLFPVILGLAVLVGAAALGGQLIFAGLRGGELTQALPGVGVLLLGLLFDGAMTHLAALGRRTVVLELFGEGRPHPLALEVDTHAGAPFLDAVLAADARRRELERYARWAAQDESWSGDEAEAGPPTPETPADAAPTEAAPGPAEAASGEAPAFGEGVQVDVRPPESAET